jgi:hypothetical protein
MIDGECVIPYEEESGLDHARYLVESFMISEVSAPYVHTGAMDTSAAAIR